MTPRHLLAPILVALAASLALPHAVPAAPGTPAGRPATAVSHPPQAPVRLDASARREIVRAVADILERNYVLPDRGRAMAERLRSRLRAGAYQTLTAPEPLRARLIQDLQAVQPDAHLALLYFPPHGGFRFVSDTDTDSTKRAEVARDERAAERARNFGITRVEMLEGGIGLLRIASFQADPERAAPSLAAAMKLLENSRALVLDVRGNPGGDPGYVALVCSYLFRKPGVLLNTIYSRPSNTTRELRTRDDLAGPRWHGGPVFVLTDGATASGGEDLAYTLQAFHRAVVVGDTTVGGAHEMSPYPFTGGYGVFTVVVPDGRVVCAATGSNWERTGVIPDLAVPGERALEAARRAALDSLVASDVDERSRARDRELIAKLRFQETAAGAAARADSALARYQGRYGERTIAIEDGHLTLQRVGGPRIRLTPVGEKTYELDVPLSPRPRVRFRLERGRVVGFHLVMSDGREVWNPRD